jgi:hypothetical protein
LIFFRERAFEAITPFSPQMSDRADCRQARAATYITHAATDIAIAPQEKKWRRSHAVSGAMKSSERRFFVPGLL